MTEVRPAPPTENFGGLTSDQIKGAISVVDLTRTPPPRAKRAAPQNGAVRFGLFHHDTYVVGTIGDSNGEKKADSDDEDEHGR